MARCPVAHRRDGRPSSPARPTSPRYWRNIVDGVDSITEVPPQRWDAEFYDPDGPARADRVYCRRGGFLDDLAEFDVDALRHHAELRAGHRARPADRAAGGARRPSRTRAGPVRCPATGTRVGIVLGRGGYLTPGLVRLDQRVRTANQLVHTLRELVPELDDDRLEQVRDGVHRAARPGAAGVRDRPGAQPRRVPGREPARPARPRVHGGRRVRVLAGRGRPRGPRAGRGPLRRHARRRRAPLPRHHAVERVQPARRAVAAASGSGRSTAAPTAS